MKFNKVVITDRGLRVIEQVNTFARPEPKCMVFYVTDDELSNLQVGERYAQA